VKGLYKMARKGEIKNYTGISAPYEEPLAPDLKVDTSQQSLDDCVDLILAMLAEKELGINVFPLSGEKQGEPRD
jgi:adenylylsulfate kinase-like enzyme